MVRVISGMGGIGKTALAVHAAHRLAPVYPDGQLFADLTDASPGEVLAQFLVGLGVDRSVVPDGLNEQTAMYRSRTAGRRVLVLLDNAPSAAVVRPLVPGARADPRPVRIDRAARGDAGGDTPAVPVPVGHQRHDPARP